jgi:hypothetical protein
MVAIVDIGTYRAIARLEEDILQIRRIVDRVGGRDDLHGVGAVVDEDLADLAAVEHGLQRLGHSGDVDSEVGSTLAIYLDRKLRLGDIGRQSRGSEAGIVLHLLDDGGRGMAELLVIVADQRELEAGAGAANAEAVGLEGEGANAGHCLQALVDFLHDLLLRALALVPGGKGHDQEATIGLAAGTSEGEGTDDFTRIA